MLVCAAISGHGITVGKYESPYEQLTGFKLQFAVVLGDSFAERQFTPELQAAFCHLWCELRYNQPIAAVLFAGLQAKQSEKWHEANLDTFLAQLEVFAPGTSMAAFAVSNATQRQVLIQYLKKQ